MANKTGIEWTDATWNPVTGCTKVSQGCKHCYAKHQAWPRLTGMPNTVYTGREFEQVMCHPERLDQPLRWMKPRRIFVNSMSDLFHEDVPDEFIDQVFAVMALTPQHTFQVLTKRPARMSDYLSRSAVEVGIGLQAMGMCLDAAVKTKGRSNLGAGVLLHASDINPGGIVNWPLVNVWLGVSVEDQDAADERIPLLLQTPAAVRWISAEPLLGPVDLRLSRLQEWNKLAVENSQPWAASSIDWVVVGGESGPNARPMHPASACNLRDQCAAAGVPFLFKQWGEWAPREPYASELMESDELCGKWDGVSYRYGKKRAGRLLDGAQHDGYPETTVCAR